MQMAMAVGDCTGEDADLLRRAMGSKRGLERIESLKPKLYAGMARNGLDRQDGRPPLRPDPGLLQLRLRRVALAVVRTAGLRLVLDQAALPGGLPRRAAARAADGVLLARPPSPPTPAATAWWCCVPTSPSRAWTRCSNRRASPGGHVSGLDSCLSRDQPPVGEFVPSAADDTGTHRRDGDFAVRLGLAEVRGIGRDVATRIVAERDAHGEFASMANLVRRTGADRRPTGVPCRCERVRQPRSEPAQCAVAGRKRSPGPARIRCPTRWSVFSHRCSASRHRWRNWPTTCGPPG